MFITPLDPLKLPRSAVAEYFLPFLPGLVFVGVCSFLRWDLATMFFQMPGLPEALKIPVVILSTFIVGHLIFAVLAPLLLFPFFALGAAFGIFYSRPMAKSESRNIVWRRLASAFTENNLVPLDEPGVTAEEMNAKADHIQRLDAIRKGDSSLKVLIPNDSGEDLAKQTLDMVARELYRDDLDNQWIDVYQMIRGYFYELNPRAVEGSISVIAIGSAGVLAMFFTQSWDGTILLCSVLAIFIGFLYAISIGFGDGLAQAGLGAQAGKILREMKKTDKDDKKP